ncbi:interleukin-10 receptor subunit beta-like isoform X1 [Sander lucioperca]|uniref:interleukin-10 receptor subunit beta-like isoform X1 n=1 Tax=Sander lucioperca TaxID=283035 RepID=UPI00125D7E14|nr:interleukin-10 receptor subunit beta-like isoform X1 [Sander lucioperca]XP_035859715.1 interleukin-10 receptor subunit beta-like isoform X1 [Sander lucioperca]
MSASISAFILTFSTLCGSRVVSGVLSPPTNVSLTSYNMNLVLRWDPPDQPASGLLYTTEYSVSILGYNVGCVNISTLECDLTNLKDSISEYGKYTGRVRVQLGTESSAWVESNQIALDRDTVIGAPDVSLFSNGATIEASIKDPVFRISSLRDVYNLATYNITYWKDGQKKKNRSISNVQQNRVVLSDLDPWTTYCVQVQISTEKHPNPNPTHSVPSAVVCESTTIEEEAPWVAAVVTFVVMAMAVAVVVVAVVYRKRISHFLCPKDALPEHFKEYLLAHPNYLDMRNSHPPKEIFDPVSIIADGSILEEGLPLEAAGTSCSQQPDTT